MVTSDAATTAAVPAAVATIKVLMETLKENPFIKFLLYQPPVGIVTFAVTYQWLIHRVLKLGNNDFLQILDDFPSITGGKATKQRPKSVDIDSIDREYNTVGGVQAHVLNQYVVELSSSLSSSTINSNVRSGISFPNSISQLVVDSACPPRASRSICARQLVNTVLDYDHYHQSSSNNNSDSYGNNNNSKMLLPQLKTLLELRALDALLRCVRDDDLLPTSNQLRTQNDLWETKVNDWGTSKRQWFQRIAIHVVTGKKPTLQQYRLQLQSTSQKLNDEYEQLGQVQQLLLQQPSTTAGDSNNDSPHLLLTKEFLEWNKRAKSLLVTVLTKRWSKVDPTTIISPEGNDDRPDEYTTTVGTDLQNLNQLSSSSTPWNQHQWLTTLTLVENIKQRRRLAQQPSSSTSISSISNHKARKLLSSWTQLTQTISRQIDWSLFGIPSVILKIAIAKAIHIGIIVPYWPQMKQTSYDVFLAIWGIIEFRFYKPFKVIIMDLLNRRPRLLDPKQLTNEEESLLNMLRDLGIDLEDKNAALAEAARLYEQQLKNGTVKNLVFGETIRLLLIQGQQLKADLLQAFQSIDELVDANRLNVSLLATIPAFLLVRWGSKIMYSLIYRLRVRDLTGLQNAHVELTSLLRQLERLLILTDGKQQQMSCKQLGEFISCQQKYLLLLDYCQPPIPTKQVDSIYKDVQDLLPCGSGGLDTETQLNLLQLIHQKNAELLKSI